MRKQPNCKENCYWYHQNPATLMLIKKFLSMLASLSWAMHIEFARDQLNELIYI